MQDGKVSIPAFYPDGVVGCFGGQMITEFKSNTG